jgi:hypothetical protein
MAKFSVIDYAGVKAVIEGIGRDCVKMNDRIQNAACNIVLHTVVHGDERLAQSLYDAVTSGTRRASLATWFQLYGPFAVEGGKIVLDKAKRDAMKGPGADDVKVDIAKLFNAKWFEAKKEESLTPVDVEDLYAKLIKRVQDKVKEGKVEVKGLELLAALELAHDKFHRDSAE